MPRPHSQHWLVVLGLGLVVGQAHAQDVTAVRFTPGGKWILAAGLDGNLRRHEGRGGKELIQAKAHPGGVFALALSRDGLVAATGGADNKIILWDVAELKPRKDWTANAQVLALAFNSANKQLAVGTTTGFTIWEVATAKALRSATPTSHAVTALAMLPDGRVVQGGVTSQNLAGAFRVREDDQARLWQGDPLQETRALGGKFGRLSLSDDGRFLAGGGYGLNVGKPGGGAAIVINGVAANIGLRACLWDLEANRELWQATDLGLEIVLSNDGRWLAVGQGRHLHLSKGPGANVVLGGRHVPVPVRLIETATGQEVLQVPITDASALAFAPDAARLAIGRLNGSLTIADLHPKDWKAPTPDQITKAWLAKAWQDLGAEPAQAYRALWDLAAAGEPATNFLSDQIPPAQLNQDQMRQDLQDLESDRFATRAAANKRLRRMGLDAEAALKRALDQGPGQESCRRLELLLQELRSAPLPATHLQAGRALIVLERQGTMAARQALDRLTTGAADAWMTREAKRALERVKKTTNIP